MNDLHNFWHKLTAPRSTDPDEARREYTTKVILVIVSAVAFAVTPLVIIGCSIRLFDLWYLLMPLLTSLLFGGGWMLAQRGRWRPGSYIPPTAIFVIAVIFNRDGGAGSTAMLFYVIAILLTAILQGGKAQWVTLALSIGAYLGLGWAHAGGLLPPPPAPETKFVEWAIVVLVSFITIALLQWFSNNQFQRALAKAQQAQSAIEQRVVVEQEQGKHLQRANLEIEKRVAVEREQRERLQRANLEIEKRAAAEQEQLEDLENVLSQLGKAANNLNAAAAEILTAATQQATGANEQSADISQTTIIVDEVKAISEQAIQRAQEVVDASQRTVQVSRSGEEAVQQTLASMAQIKARVESIAENILALSTQTQQIGEIITTVNNIAAQSNMLALNASVEAARAGKHGKGFAVVADEVRNLAERSKQATAQARAILSDIQDGIDATVIATEEGTKVVDQGVELAEQTGAVIERLVGTIDEAAQAATQMRAGGQQQATGVEQIAMAMQNINQTTAQGLTSTRQAEKAARDLNNLAFSLIEIVKQYQLD